MSHYFNNFRWEIQGTRAVRSGSSNQYIVTAEIVQFAVEQ